MTTFYKAFDENLKCRGFQYEIGKTYTHNGEIDVCSSGFHSCENPLDVLNYYDLTTSRFATVSIDGKVSKKENDDSKVSSENITILKELNLGEYINECVSWLQNNNKVGVAASADNSKLAASGDDSQLAASGYNSKLAARGDNSQLAASGYNSKLAASGYNSKLAASGYNSKLAASGYNSKLAASAYNSKLAASGDNSQLAASGHNSKLAARGDNSQLAASGHNSKLAARGDNSQLAASGDDSQLAANGERSVIVSSGCGCKAKLDHPGPIALTWFDKISNQYRCSVGQVGENLLPGVWYTLNDIGEFIECDKKSA